MSVKIHNNTFICNCLKCGSIDQVNIDAQGFDDDERTFEGLEFEVKFNGNQTSFKVFDSNDRSMIGQKNTDSYMEMYNIDYLHRETIKYIESGPTVCSKCFSKVSVKVV